MSRSGYNDECDDHWGLIRWRGAVNSAIRGKRGQQLLRDLITALDAMPEKRLIAEELEANGQVCALGSVGKHRGLAMQEIDPDDYDQVSSLFGIAPALAKEIMFENDDGAWGIETSQQRWKRMRQWAVIKLRVEHL